MNISLFKSLLHELNNVFGLYHLKLLQKKKNAFCLEI